MKFLIIGDLHGNKPKIHFKDFDAIIAPGDFCSDKYMRPLIKRYMKYVIKNKDNKKIYSAEEYFKKVLKIKKSDFNRFDTKMFEDGRKVIKFLNSFDKPVFIVPGNWDYGSDEDFKKRDSENPVTKYKAIYKMYSAPHTDKRLTQGFENVYDCQLKHFEFPDFNIIGYGMSSFPEMPQVKRIKNKTRYNKINKAYNKLFCLVEKENNKKNRQKPTIFLTHNVPYNTKLDIVINKNSWADKQHYGSTIARDYCLKYKPLVCIGGHIHEHFKKDKLGKTVLINAGFGSKVNVLLDIKGKKIKKIEFYPKKHKHKH